MGQNLGIRGELDDEAGPRCWECFQPFFHRSPFQYEGYLMKQNKDVTLTKKIVPDVYNTITHQACLSTEKTYFPLFFPSRIRDKCVINPHDS